MAERLNLLVVEDSEEDALLVIRQLARAGFQIKHRRVETPEEMSAALEEENWDAILSDYSMPRFSALAALELVRERRLDLPFIVVSGTVGEDVAVDAMRRGAHDYLMKDRLKRIGEAVRREMHQARVRAERRKAEAQLEYLNRVLQATREVNQLIVREKSRDRLVQRACDTLIRTRGFKSAWIVLTEEPAGKIEAAHASLSDDVFSDLVDIFRRGELPGCCRLAETEQIVVSSQEQAGACKGCPLEEAYAGATALTASLVYEGKRYGFLSVSVPTGFANDEEELSLFKETAEDISFALYNMEAERARQESEQTLSTIFDGATDGILVADAETQRFVNANRAICRMLGYTREEIEGLSVADLHSAESLEYVVTQFKKQLNGEITLSRDIPVRRKDGSVFYADVNAAPVELRGRMHLLGMFRDVTERRQAEQKLRDTIEELQKAQKQLTQQAGWMQSLNSISGEIARRNSLESIMRVAMQYLEESFPFALGGIELSSEEEKASSISVLSSRGRSLASGLGIEEGVRISAEHSFLRSSIELHQARTLRLSEIEPAGLSGQGSLLFQDLKREGLKTVVVVPLDTEKTRIGAIFMIYREDVVLSEPEWRFLNGMAEYVSLSAQNWKLYRELEASYKQLKDTQEAMMRQERLNAMGQMASGVAHDINNVLVPVSLYTEALLENEPGLSDRANRFLKTIQSSVRDIENITLRLRSFYKKEEEADFQFIDIEDLFDGVIELTRPRWKAMPYRQGIVIQLEKELEEKLPSILGSESEIRESLVNLVFNAVDAMPEGGTITLRARKEGQHVLMEVADTGVGMNEEQRRRCLEPFYTTKGKKGSGLGLSGVYGMVQRHKGDIEIQSEPGKGTSVRVLFPLFEKKPKKTASFEESAPVPSLRILCVDDDQKVREVLKEMLILDGHEVQTCSSGEEAVKLFRAEKGGERSFELVITDLGMPHMDGKAVAREIKRASPATPVILFSGWGNFMNMNGELPENIDCLLGKPPGMDLLRNAIRELTAGREQK
jgi:PAS domain S-box-containing protein